MLIGGAGRLQAGTTSLDDFFVDAAHANPNDPHEVFAPNFNGFTLTITGTFDLTKCYEVSIMRTGGGDGCGSANSSGGDVASFLADCPVVGQTCLVADISPNAAADFKRGSDWVIEVRERTQGMSGCTGGSTVFTHPIALKIAGCNSTCFLAGVDLSTESLTTDCGGSPQMCAFATESSGNLRFDWDLDGDGQYDDLTTFPPNNCIDLPFYQDTTVGVKVTDLGTQVSPCEATADVALDVNTNSCEDGIACTVDTCDPNLGCTQVNQCCGQGGDCCEDHTGPGCTDATCCGCICSLMPECCTGDWGALCTALTLELCQSDCPCAQPDPTGSCCDGDTGNCSDDVMQVDCSGGQLTWTEGVACADLIPACTEHTGACCDQSQPGGACTDDVPGSQCVGPLLQYAKGVACADLNPVCSEVTGACCDHAQPGGSCQDDVAQSLCAGGQLEWFGGTTCAVIESPLAEACREHTGACCDRASGCTDDVPGSQCTGPEQFYFKGETCADVAARGCCADSECNDNDPCTAARVCDPGTGKCGDSPLQEAPESCCGATMIRGFGECTDLTPSCCEHRSGTPGGPGTSCSLEACCFGSTCASADPICCRAATGVPQGPGSTCDVPTDGCCGDAECDDMDPCTPVQICDPLTGNCANSDIQPAPQACCLTTGTCEDLVPECCTGRSGQPQGPSTACSDPGMCVADGACCNRVSPPGFCTDNVPAAQCFGDSLHFFPGETCEQVSARRCCSDVECDDGVACTRNLCTAVGECLFVPDNIACDDGNECTIDTCCNDTTQRGDTCDILPGGGCLNQPFGGTMFPFACDDENACTENDICLNGVCTGVDSCDDGDPCTDDVCDPASGCSNPPNAETVRCCGENVVGIFCADFSRECCISRGGTPGDPGSACVAVEACCRSVDQGDPFCELADPECCRGLGGTPGGPGSTCSAFEEFGACCLTEVTGATGCRFVDPTCCSLANGTFLGTGTQCDTRGGDSCCTNAECDDQDACTTESCVDGQCSRIPLVCDDGDPCTDDGCEPKGGCFTTPNANLQSCCRLLPSGGGRSGSFCEMRDPDCCESVGGTPGGDGTQCSERGACCATLPNGAQICEFTDPICCDMINGTFLGEGETCNDPTDELCCVDTECDDGDPCTDDSCGADNRCEHAENADVVPCCLYDFVGQVGSSCMMVSRECCLSQGGIPGTPGSACTAAEACCIEEDDRLRGLSSCSMLDPLCCALLSDFDPVFTTPQGLGTSCTDPTDGCCTDSECNDDIDCTIDLCQNAQCVNTPNHEACPSDDNVCTAEVCDPTQFPTGCGSIPIEDANGTRGNIPCDDGNPCTVGDHCNDGACEPGDPRVCDDQIDCTNDTCNPATPNGCVFTPNDGKCDDDNVCTRDVCCVDGVDCPGSANKLVGCFHVPLDSPDWDVRGPGVVISCDDGNACTTDDRCQDGVCQGGPPPDCNDDDPCTTDKCIPPIIGCQNNCELIRPTISCPKEDIYVMCSSVQGVPVEDVEIIVTPDDNCDENPMILDNRPANYFPPTCPGDAPTIVRFVARDRCGNESDPCTVRVFVDGTLCCPGYMDGELTLMSADADLRQETDGPVTTRATFDIWNQNERRFSETTRCITCWDSTLLSLYGPPNQFRIGVVHTDKIKVRIDGSGGTACGGATSTPLLGVAVKEVSFETRAGTNILRSALTGVGSGVQSATLRYDPPSLPESISLGGATPAALIGLPDVSLSDRPAAPAPSKNPRTPQAGVSGGRGDIAQKGSLLYWPKVQVRWDAQGNIIEDTFLSLTNDFPFPVYVQMYVVNGDHPLAAECFPDCRVNFGPACVNFPDCVAERAHPGCNWMDVTLPLTPDQPTYWSVSTGQPAGTQPYWVLDHGDPIGRPDLDPRNPGGRVIRGFIVGWAVNRDGREIRWNHLSGNAMQVHYTDASAAEYNAYAFQCVAEVDTGVQPDAVPGRLLLNGLEYEFAPEKLLFDLYTVGSRGLSNVGIRD